MTRVLLVDDHPVVRAGLRALLEASGVEVVAEADRGEAAVEAVRGLPVDVVLMDLQLGSGMDGVAATERVLALPGPPRVLILTTYDTDADILRAVEAGASGYLLKDAPPEELVDAVRRAAAGETVLAPVVAQRLVSRLRSPVRTLSPRELDVLRLLAAGSTNRAIAKQLFVTEATVKSHLVHIYAKLGVDSRTAAVTAAREAGLLR
ncbi:response regulator transcription factor [Luteipulveratus sp. YIM 133132]|uniref:response regulator n=1 Tax=Luteipulveratus flavus TaxID=3031728 RepID=UPI0023AF624D|nr:response regulator transcription factor [Luteipulveratus sp. YIM 133132]MDE9364856.1 response regulator transcription factor [Luteipulveratus sp. YIM 133132]